VNTPGTAPRRGAQTKSPHVPLSCWLQPPPCSRSPLAAFRGAPSSRPYEATARRAPRSRFSRTDDAGLRRRRLPFAFARFLFFGRSIEAVRLASLRTTRTWLPSLRITACAYGICARDRNASGRPEEWLRRGIPLTAACCACAVDGIHCGTSATVRWCGRARTRQAHPAVRFQRKATLGSPATTAWSVLEWSTADRCARSLRRRPRLALALLCGYSILAVGHDGGVQWWTSAPTRSVRLA